MAKYGFSADSIFRTGASQAIQTRNALPFNGLFTSSLLGIAPAIVVSADEPTINKMNPNKNITTSLRLTAASFEAEVLKSNQPVLVVFGAPWSRPCQVLDPILQELAQDWAGKVKLVKVNADDSLDLSLCYDIQSVPTLLYFVAGKPWVRIVGTATKDAILAKLKASGGAHPIDTLKEASGVGAANSKGGLI